jgi:hypothetical protein
LPERGGKLILIPVSFALDGIHQVPNAMSFRIHNFPHVLSLEKTITLRADGIAVQVTKRLTRVPVDVIDIFDLEDCSAEAVGI